MLRNNDQSVRIFSLTQSRLLETLEFPIAMNHASISPDGKLLLAVGDRHTAFFCKRARLLGALSDGVSSYARYEWHEIAALKLSLAESKDAWYVHLRDDPFDLVLKLSRKTYFGERLIFSTPETCLATQLSHLKKHADSKMCKASLLPSHHPVVRAFLRIPLLLYP